MENWSKWQSQNLQKRMQHWSESVCTTHPLRTSAFEDCNEYNPLLHILPRTWGDYYLKTLNGLREQNSRNCHLRVFWWKGFLAADPPTRPPIYTVVPDRIFITCPNWCINSQGSLDIWRKPQIWKTKIRANRRKISERKKRNAKHWSKIIKIITNNLRKKIYIPSSDTLYSGKSL